MSTLSTMGATPYTFPSEGTSAQCKELIGAYHPGLTNILDRVDRVDKTLQSLIRLGVHPCFLKLSRVAILPSASMGQTVSPLFGPA